MNIQNLSDQLVSLSSDCDLLISTTLTPVSKRKAISRRLAVYSPIDLHDDSLAPLKARLHTFATKGAEVIRDFALSKTSADEETAAALGDHFKNSVMAQLGANDARHFWFIVPMLSLEGNE